MQQSKRETLVSQLEELGFSNSDDKTIAVSLTEFFDGNDDETSLARKLDPHPGLEALNYHLARFANNHDVEVYVEIFEVDEDDDEIWPCSERVYLIGGIDTSLLDELSSVVLASAVEEFGDYEINGEIFNDVFALWWD